MTKRKMETPEGYEFSDFENAKWQLFKNAIEKMEGTHNFRYGFRVERPDKGDPIVTGIVDCDFWETPFHCEIGLSVRRR